jgi:hypothetical protein
MVVERITIEWYPINNPLIGLVAGHLYLVGREAGQTNGLGYAITATLLARQRLVEGRSWVAIPLK